MKTPRSDWAKSQLRGALGSATLGFALMCVALTLIFHLVIVERFIVPGEDVVMEQVGNSYEPYRALHYWKQENDRWSEKPQYRSLESPLRLNDGYSYYGIPRGTVSTWEALPAEDRDRFHNYAHERSETPFYGLGEGWLFKWELLFVTLILSLRFGPVWYPRTRRELLLENRHDYERAAALRSELESQPDPFEVPNGAGGDDLGKWRPTSVEPLFNADIRHSHDQYGRGRTRMVADPFHGGFVLTLVSDGGKVLCLVCPGRESLLTLFARTVEGWFRENQRELPRNSHMGVALAEYDFGAAGLDSRQVHTRLMRDMELPLAERPTLHVRGQMIAPDMAIATELVHQDGVAQTVAPAGFFAGLQRTLADLSGVRFSPLPLERLVERPALRG